MAENDSGWSLKTELLVYALILAVLLSPVVYALTFDTTSEAGAEWEATPSGPTVYFDEDRSLPSGSPFPGDHSIHIQTSSGSAFYNGSADTQAQIDEINGTWSNVSQLDVSAGNLSINPENMESANVSGDIKTFAFKGEAKVNDKTIDAYYSGNGGTGSITLQTNGSSGTNYGLIDNDTEEALAVDVSDSNGQVVFQDLPTSSHDVRVEELGDLTIREESEPHDLVTGADVTVRFFEEDGDTIVEKSDTDGDGKIDLTGLPVDEQFVAQINTTDHFQRTVVIEDLSQQETVFVLNESATPGGLEKEFIIDDQIGKFDSDSTEIIISRAINQSKYASGGFDYLNIAGDDVGADRAYIVTLQEDVRYRIKVRNEDGDVRQLGAFTPKVAGTTNLEIGSIIANQTNVSDIAWNATLNETSDTILVSFNDTRDLTDTLWIEIHEFQNRSNKLMSNTSYSGPLGTVDMSESIPNSKNQTTWVVRITADRSGAENFHASEPLSPQQTVLDGMSPWIKSIMSLGAIWVVAGLFSQLNGDIGAVVVAGMGAMFWFVGFAPGSLGVGVVILSMVTAGLIFVNERRDGGL